MASEAALPAHTVTFLRSHLPRRLPHPGSSGRSHGAGCPQHQGRSQRHQDGDGRILWGLLSCWWPRAPRHPQVVETQGSAAAPLLPAEALLMRVVVQSPPFLAPWTG